jgi:hypothetical protein
MKFKEIIRVQVAQIVISISCDQPDLVFNFHDALSSFITDHPPEINIQLSYQDLPDLKLTEEDRLFDSASIWALYQSGSKKVLLLGASSLDANPDGLAIIDEDSRVVQLFKSRDLLSKNKLPDPLEFPMGEVLMICLLANQRGLLVHACGIDDNGHGYLFAGNSTHGKSTLARLWKNEATILNDDRIILRERDGRAWLYGTPWHGEFDSVSMEGVPLEKIFFLRHAPSNAVHPVHGAKAVSMLISRVFPPIWDEEGMQFSLSISDHIIGRVPCYILDFIPDQSVIGFVRCVN